MTDDDPEIERSPLCGSVTRDGITIQVQIYRLAEGWSLKVIDQDDAPRSGMICLPLMRKPTPNSIEHLRQRAFDLLPSGLRGSRTNGTFAIPFGFLGRNIKTKQTRDRQEIC